MAGAPYKSGFDYHPLSTDFFEESAIQFVSATYGFSGESVAVRLLCKIYKNGYYLPFDDDAALLFARATGDISKHKFILDVVKELLKRGFFHQGMHDKFKVLTSADIQATYERICTNAKRKNWSIESIYCLLNQSVLVQQEKQLLPELIGNDSSINPEFNTQSKVKDSIVHKNTGTTADEPPTHPPEVMKDWKDFQQWVNTNAPRINQMKNPLTIDQYLQLRQTISDPVFFAVLESMENRADLIKKNLNTNLTIQNWAKRQQPIPNATQTTTIQPNAYQRARQRTAQLASQC